MACGRCGFGSWSPRDVDGMGLDEVAWLLGVGSRREVDPETVLLTRVRLRRQLGREPEWQEIEAALTAG